MRVDQDKIDKAFDHLDEELALTFKKAAVEAHIAGDVTAQQQLGMKVSFKLIKSAATEYGKEYSRLLTERGGGYVVENGQLVFKDWFKQSSLANREKVAGIINDGIRDGRSVRDMKKDLKEFFNQRKQHAEMVARTETAKIQGIATRQRLIEQGIKKMQWFTAEDEKVRSEHADRHLQIFDVDNAPALGEPNCRCTLIPYVEDVPDVDLSQPLPEKKVKVPKTVNPASPVSEFMPAKNVTLAEERLNAAGVEFTNMRGVPVEQANAFLKAVENVPSAAIPDAFGNGASFGKFMNRPLKRKAGSWYGVSVKFPGLYAPEGYQMKKAAYNIVGMNTKDFKTLKAITEKKIAYNAAHFKKHGTKYFFNEDGGLVHYHELGHILDNNKMASGTDKWKGLVQKWNSETSVKYDVLHSESEAFAEAFADIYGNGGARVPDYIKEYVKGFDTARPSHIIK